MPPDSDIARMIGKTLDWTSLVDINAGCLLISMLDGKRTNEAYSAEPSFLISTRIMNQAISSGKQVKKRIV